MVQTRRVATTISSMLMLAAFALLAFWFRDYLALRMSPSRQAGPPCVGLCRLPSLLIATFHLGAGNRESESGNLRSEH